MGTFDRRKLRRIIEEEARTDAWREYNPGYKYWDLLIPGEVRFRCQDCAQCCLGAESEVIPLRGTEELCEFLKDGRCAIYDHRPIYCHLFPFRAIHRRRTEGQYILIYCRLCPGIGQAPIIGWDAYEHLLTYWSTEGMYTDDAEQTSHASLSPAPSPSSSPSSSSSSQSQCTKEADLL